MSDRRVFSWTRATVRWWNRLGHIDDCPCKKKPGQITFRIPPGQPQPENYLRIWECWAQAVEKLSQPPPDGLTTPSEGVWASRAMYAFRDRASVPRG